MLNRLLPNRLPMAISSAPIFIAVMVVTSSGNEVTIATRVVPTKVVPSPVISAISALERTIQGVTITNARAASPKPVKPRSREGVPAGISMLPAGRLTPWAWLVWISRTAKM